MSGAEWSASTDPIKGVVMNLLQVLLKRAGVPHDVGRIPREVQARAALYKALREGADRRSPMFDDMLRAGEAHPDFGGPQ